MKPIIFSFFVHFLHISFIAGQSSITLTFTGQLNTQHIVLDSIRVKNISNGSDTILHGDTVLVLQSIAGIEQHRNQSKIRLHPNFPNPFSDFTEIALELSYESEVGIRLFDMKGSLLYSLSERLSIGKHYYKISTAKSGKYIVHVVADNYQSSVKITSNAFGEHSTNSISHASSFLDRLNTKQTKTLFTWQSGNSLQYTGYASSGGVLTDIITDSPTQSTFYTFQFSTGGSNSCPGIPTVTDVSGNVYTTVQIGNQCWMAENLKTQHQFGNSWCYGNNTANCGIYGRMYDWAAVMNGSSGSNTVPSGVQGICPSGWHVPSDAEWNILVSYLGGEQIAGGKMKSTGTSLWFAPNAGATNESGYTALPGGFRHSMSNMYFGLGEYAFWWSSTEQNATSAWNRNLDYSDTKVYRFNYLKTDGFYVRCIKD